MKIIDVLLDILKDARCDEGSIEKFKEFISDIGSTATFKPRDDTYGNRKLLSAIFYAVINKVDYLFGEDDGTEIHPNPFFSENGPARIGPLKDNNKIFGLEIGQLSVTWEDVFYDICHETVHLLNPIMDVKSEKVSALEEGVAVKFAEEMFAKYIKTYTNIFPVASPIYAEKSQYYEAYHAVKDIPNDVLKAVRRDFVMFSKINDFEKFKKNVGFYIDDEKIKSLMKDFVYT